MHWTKRHTPKGRPGHVNGRARARRLAHWSIAVTGIAAILAALPVAASPELVRAKNCVACHSAERKLIGPSYKDIAKRYRNDKEAAARLAIKVREGGGGAWGVVKMPANPQVHEQESLAIVRWILSQP